MSRSRYITLSSSIPIYNTLLEHLEKVLDGESNNYYSEIRVVVEKRYEKLKRYYIKTDKSYVYPIATSKFYFFLKLKYIYLYLFNYYSVLDPRIKLKYYQTQEWEQEYIDAALEIVTNVYNINYKQNATSPINDKVVDLNDFLANVFGKNNEIKVDELEDYIQKPIVPFKTDPLQWWKVN